MARHNRDGRGSDQRGFDYLISYQPDWAHEIRISRVLESGRQSTKLLFRNPEAPVRPPGARIRTHVSSPAQKLRLGLDLEDPDRIVKRVIVETEIRGRSGPAETVIFTVDGVPND